MHPQTQNQKLKFKPTSASVGNKVMLYWLISQFGEKELGEAVEALKLIYEKMEAAEAAEAAESFEYSEAWKHVRKVERFR